jgi:hypothetical protein
MEIFGGIVERFKPIEKDWGKMVESDWGKKLLRNRMESFLEIIQYLN